MESGREQRQEETSFVRQATDETIVCTLGERAVRNQKQGKKSQEKLIKRNYSELMERVCVIFFLVVYKSKNIIYTYTYNISL